MASRRNQFVAGLFVVALLAVVPSCNIGFNVTPPAEAILFGAWNVLLASNPSLQEILVFNESGRLVERRITVGATTVSQPDVHRLTRVSGNNVRIETSDNNVFEGTLNADKNIIDGKFSTILTIGSTTITTDNGGVTLTKI
ncbi:MAG: hypothetical protein HZA51_08625 [Planctomycetes bacterium]|nr:hypothetical protein [Planctomycetota bacterium]